MFKVETNKNTGSSSRKRLEFREIDSWARPDHQCSSSTFMGLSVVLLTVHCDTHGNANTVRKYRYIRGRQYLPAHLGLVWLEWVLWMLRTGNEWIAFSPVLTMLSSNELTFKTFVEWSIKWMQCDHPTKHLLYAHSVLGTVTGASWFVKQSPIQGPHHLFVKTYQWTSDNCNITW